MEGSVTFCQDCYDEVLRLAPMIVEVPQDHGRYRSGQSVEGGLPSYLVKWLTRASSCKTVPGKMVARQQNA